MLIEHEGSRAMPYTDTVGKVTIGVGRNLTDIGLFDNEIDLLLTNDIDRVIADLNRELPWNTTLSEDHQLVLGDMCFNLGIGGLLGFKKFLAAMEAGDFPAARKEMLDSKWATQVGSRALDLADMVYGITV